MTRRVGAKGQVVIPKRLRDELALQPGSEVDFEHDGGSVRILPAGAAGTRGLRGRYASSGSPPRSWTSPRPAQSALSICLDSWAVLAWLDGEEPAAGAVSPWR